ncbi:OmpH family outer membrane protein [Maribellus sediminis]|uniref:OmpH family outer membrane protein n=1 Tax=Maribellus sediminis TaxID=2696285 RepID=UPI0014314BBB|nr:OmpH family outer membrane protein [Maribellus sediminis]
MKNLMKLLAVLLITVSAATVNAQTLKFGHIDLQALVQVMPERTAAEAEYNKFQGELEEILGEMQQDLQTKYGEFEQMGQEVSQIKRDAKVTEIQEIQQRIQNYQVTAQQQMNQKQNELLGPVFEKAENAIAEVAKEKGLIYVFDSGQGNRTILYKSNQSLDILPLVKAKLGIQ